MEEFSSLFKKQHIGELLISILFIIYLIMGYKTPEPVANAIDTIVGKIVILMLVAYLFMHSNTILAVLGLFVAFDLIRRASMTTGIDALRQYEPTEQKKSSQFTALNQFPYTLEQEVVKKMAPIVQGGSSMSKASYSPILEDLHDASPIN